MKISVKAKVHSKNPGITKLGERYYQVAVTQAPERGAANRAICAAIAKHFAVAPSCVTITSGHKNQHKVIEIIIPLNN